MCCNLKKLLISVLARVNLIYEISLVKAIVSLGPCAYCGCGLQALAMPTTSTVTIHASERWSLPRYTINHLKVEIRASLVSERVGPLGFDVSINNNYTSYRILNQSFTVKGGI